MLFRNGLNAKQVEMWLGLHSPAFTLDTYVHLLPDDLPEPTFLHALTRGNTEATDPSENHREIGLDESPEVRISPAEPKPAEIAAAIS